jgi:hypothetical protein
LNAVKMCRLEGYISVPRLGGVRKGWCKAFLRSERGVIYLYEKLPRIRNQQLPKELTPLDPGDALVNPVPLTMVDALRSRVQVMAVEEADVIHAASRDVPRIFKLMSYAEGRPSCELLLMADSHEEQVRWLERFRLFLADVQRCGDVPSDVAVGCITTPASLPEVRPVTCAAVVDEHTLLVGGASGAYIVRESGRAPFLEQKKLSLIVALHALPAPQSKLVMIYGKTPQARVAWRLLLFFPPFGPGRDRSVANIPGGGAAWVGIGGGVAVSGRWGWEGECQGGGCCIGLAG